MRSRSRRQPALLHRAVHEDHEDRRARTWGSKTRFQSKTEGGGLPGNYVLLSVSARGVLRRATEAAWMAGIGSPTTLYVLDALLARVRKQLAQLLERASVERREVRRVLNEILPESRRSMPTPKWAIETAAIDERDYRWIRKIRMGERAQALMGEGRGGESRVARRISASKRAEA